MSNELICIVFLGILYVYQSYRFWKLKHDVFTQLSKLWLVQKELLQLIKRLYERNKNEESNIDD